ncbi:MAG: ParB/RepB/Spo0J family partition protein [Candidatus Jorgensenbacteria bacterium]|nr:ParB/RepB/Spo0J family partition protein [Candidatus Jorgensenbacteria bacterium]
MGLESLIPKRDNFDPSIRPVNEAGIKSESSLEQIKAKAEPAFAPQIRAQVDAIISKPMLPIVSPAVEKQNIEVQQTATPQRDQRVNPPSPQHDHGRAGDAVFHIEVEKIKPNPYQPRKVFNKEELDELAQSIREFGIIQPLVVSKVVAETETGTSVEYQLIAGERRLMAAKLAGFERVPVIIRQAESKQTKLELALIENIQRSNLNPLESARAYARLQDEFELTQREVAARVGKSREAVANTLRLLSLPAHIQEALAGGKINESQARALLAISDPNEQNKMFVQLASGAMSVRAMQAEAKNPAQANPETQYWKKKLEEFFGAPVDITRRGARGKLTVQFYSDDEWQSLIDRLFGKEEAV